MLQLYMLYTLKPNEAGVDLLRYPRIRERGSQAARQERHVHSPLSSLSHCCLIIDLKKSGTGARELISTLKKLCRREMTHQTFPHDPRMWGKTKQNKKHHRQRKIPAFQFQNTLRTRSPKAKPVLFANGQHQNENRRCLSSIVVLSYLDWWHICD